MTRNGIPLTKLIERLAVQFSALSLEDRGATSSSNWSPLERLTPEIFAQITGILAFFDQKALSSSSQRVYSLMGSLHPPDRAAWTLHMCASFNRASDDLFDVTVFDERDFRDELKRMAQQLPKDTSRYHYTFDPKTTRIEDLTCVYFSSGARMEFRDQPVQYQTLGQFTALVFNEYIRKIVAAAQRGERLAYQLGMRPTVARTDAHKRLLWKEAHIWQGIGGAWL